MFIPKYQIKNVEFTHDENGNREVHVTLSNESVVKICECCESFEQYGCTYEEKQITVEIAQLANGWLHGEHLTEKTLSDIDHEVTAINNLWKKFNQ